MSRKQNLEQGLKLTKQKHELRMKAFELEHQKEVMELRVELEMANSLPTAVKITGIPRIQIQPFN
jgi:hypothetical protein